MTLTFSGKITLRNGWQPMDPDAAAYIAAVETADAQALEEKVKIAIDNFVLGCKADGIWNAIKASCILAGARTLGGALVPLTGTAPTNVGPFVAADYDRKTGLAGDGSTKYLDSNRNNAADPQANNHNAVYISVAPTINVSLMGAGITDVGTNSLLVGSTRNRSSTAVALPSTSLGFIGAARTTGVNYTNRSGAINLTHAQAPQIQYAFNLYLFARNANGTPLLLSNARIAFYSIGESLDLVLLDARVTDLINKFAEVIP